MVFYNPIKAITTWLNKDKGSSTPTPTTPKPTPTPTKVTPPMSKVPNASSLPTGYKVGGSAGVGSSAGVSTYDVGTKTYTSSTGATQTRRYQLVPLQANTGIKTNYETTISPSVNTPQQNINPSKSFSLYSPAQQKFQEQYFKPYEKQPLGLKVSSATGKNIYYATFGGVLTAVPSTTYTTGALFKGISKNLQGGLSATKINYITTGTKVGRLTSITKPTIIKSNIIKGSSISVGESYTPSLEMSSGRIIKTNIDKTLGIQKAVSFSNSNKFLQYSFGSMYKNNLKNVVGYRGFSGGVNIGSKTYIGSLARFKAGRVASFGVLKNIDLTNRMGIGTRGQVSLLRNIPRVSFIKETSTQRFFTPSITPVKSLPKLATFSLTGLSLTTRTKAIQVQTPRTITTTRLIQTPRTITTTRLIQTPRTIITHKLIQSPRLTTNVITPIIPIVPKIPIPLFNIPTGDFNFSRGSKSYKGKRKYKYTPSYEAFVFNIRGKQPKGIETGLRIRPIPKGFSFFKVRRLR